ncbi:hypothetical protein B0A52_05182 [Exophiala mesophila]|uniref:Zn(2)-C6 fungal-type domain-containing protein n=1 Tax=Exophiala mesophila TaxID=212818 RepID=A0A438N4B5_EXOME|nr:hypothetical protein B0A52_05182 [Exophiala mesophila]
MSSLPSTPQQPSDMVTGSLSFCKFCDKPFTNASSYQRHIRYCARHVRSRPRSCRSCNAAKTKCSFDWPCSRCVRKGHECQYSGSGSAIQPGGTKPSTAHPKHHNRGPDYDETPRALDAEKESWFDADVLLTDNLVQDDASRQVLDPTRPASYPDLPTFDEFVTFEDSSMEHQQFPAGTSSSLKKGGSANTMLWCAWMDSNPSLAIVAQDSPITAIPSPWPDFLGLSHFRRPRNEHNADIIIQALRAFPTMMLRRETFPWFIHPQSQLLSTSPSPNACLPEALSTCMSIAQMFLSRTSETRSFHRQMINAEHHRLTLQMYQMSKYQLLSALQACMIYLIMLIIDYSPGDEENGRVLLGGVQGLYTLFKQVGGTCSQKEEADSRKAWEEWIYAESKRRYAALWLLVGYVVCVKNGRALDSSHSYRSLMLPCPKSLWEAKTQSSWEAELQACRVLKTSALVTLGDLVDAQKSDYTPTNALNLDMWNAGTDNLGTLLNLVCTME